MAVVDRGGRDEAMPAPDWRSTVYVHRLRAAIASMASAMNGLDVLVFTGGVGENAASIRAEAAAGLGFLGIRIDERANASPVLDADITAAGAGVRTVVVEAREDLQIAAEVRALTLVARRPWPEPHFPRPHHSRR